MTNNYFKVSIRVTPSELLDAGVPGLKHLLPRVPREPKPGRPPRSTRTWLFFFDATSADSARLAWTEAHAVWSALHDKREDLRDEPAMSVYGPHAADVTADLIGHFEPCALALCPDDADPELLN